MALALDLEQKLALWLASKGKHEKVAVVPSKLHSRLSTLTNTHPPPAPSQARRVMMSAEKRRRPPSDGAKPLSEPRHARKSLPAARPSATLAARNVNDENDPCIGNQQVCLVSVVVGWQSEGGAVMCPVGGAVVRTHPRRWLRFSPRWGFTWAKRRIWLRLAHIMNEISLKPAHTVAELASARQHQENPADHE